MTTSLHGPYELGYRCVTKKMTKFCKYFVYLPKKFSEFELYSAT